ncbi:MAG TPA: LuxR C-terminal-related transcriptional regulator [Gaiellaceae bacterium]|nr:LuxR C-terminal-related transcriptional regulator [Gaiellaceae bacterium]
MSVDLGDELERGRDAYARLAWTEAYEAFRRADAATPLPVDDVELLGVSATMLGRDDEWMSCLERAHRLHLEAGDELRAVRCGFWLGMILAVQGELGPAIGWFSRSQRLLDHVERDCVEHGYLLVPEAFRQDIEGDVAASAETFRRAAEIAERFGDRDLFALAVHRRGLWLLRLGKVDEGLALLDESMVSVTAGEVSPFVTGMVYCGVIAGCQEIYEVRRAQEWTAALARWRDRQPDLVAFSGRCLVHRAEILQLRGAWGDALAEARQAEERYAEGMVPIAVGQAFYLQAEVLRLRGSFAEAEASYKDASRHGFEPQPGLALLRLAQGDQPSASATLRRALAETDDAIRRIALLPAAVEVLLAGDDVVEGRQAADELVEQANVFPSAMLRALVDHAQGAVALAEGDPPRALAALRSAQRTWLELEAPYETARARVLIGVACRSLGDEDAAVLELGAAREVFEELGAIPDVAQVDALELPVATGDTYGLTARELEVLRLVASGKTNRDIAAELVISEHTVARHVQNIFAKLDVSSRTAAGAFAHEHQLLY